MFRMTAAELERLKSLPDERVSLRCDAQPTKILRGPYVLLSPVERDALVAEIERLQAALLNVDAMVCVQRPGHDICEVIAKALA